MPLAVRIAIPPAREPGKASNPVITRELLHPRLTQTRWQTPKSTAQPCEAHKIPRLSKMRIAVLEGAREIGIIAIGIVDVIKKINIDGAAIYVLKRESHKHILQCDVCRKCVEIPCPMEEIEEAIKAKVGFSLTKHKLELNGICDECKKFN